MGDERTTTCSVCGWNHARGTGHATGEPVIGWAPPVVGDDEDICEPLRRALREVQAVAAGSKDTADRDEATAMLDHIDGIARRALAADPEGGPTDG